MFDQKQLVGVLFWRLASRKDPWSAQALGLFRRLLERTMRGAILALSWKYSSSPSE